MMSLAIDEGTEVQNNALGLISLAEDCCVCMLKSSKLLLISLPFAFKLFGNFLLENKCFKGIISLFLRTRQPDSETSGIILLLVDEVCKTTILPFVILNLNLEVLCLFGELLSKRLKFEELLLPRLEFFDKKIVALGDFDKLGIHTAFEVDKVLPGFESIAGVLVAFANDFVEMAHRDLGHEWFLD